VRHLRSDASSAQQVLLNKRQIWGGAPKLDCYHGFMILVYRSTVKMRIADLRTAG